MSVEKQNGPEKQKHAKKKVIVISVLIILVMLAGIAGLVYTKPWNQPTETSADQTVTVKKGSLTIAATATGTTAVGSLTQNLNWSPGTTELVVAEVFVKAGSKVAQGDKLLKVTDDSLKTVRTELEKSVANASVALEQAKIVYESDLVSARSEQDANVSLKTTARMLYDETITALEKTVSDAKTNLTDAKSIISKNPSLITAKKKSISSFETKLANANTALTSAQAAYPEKKAAYEPIAKAYNEAKAAAETAHATFEFATAYAADNGGVEALGPGFAGFLSAAEADWHAREVILTDAETGWKTAKTALDEAQDAQADGQTAVRDLTQTLAALGNELTSLENSLTQAKANLASLQVRYDQSVVDQKTRALEAEQTYQKSLQTSEQAAALYEIAALKIEQTYQTAQKTLADAEENLAGFKSAIGDGSLLASTAGTLTKVGYAAGDALSASTAITTYSDATAVTATVSVDQVDISSIKVGDAVSVAFTSGSAQPYAGKVTSIAMSSSSVSVSSVKYSVTVALDGDTSRLSAGMTATVSFVKASLTDALYVNTSAVTVGTTSSYVQKMVNGQSVQTAVTTGGTSGNFMVITSGLSEGDVCVIKKTTTTKPSTVPTTRTAGNSTTARTTTK